jgi:hypothetical protein
MLDWAKVGPVGINAWDGDAAFQVADWMGTTSPIDAVVILALAVAGAYLVLAPLFGMTAPRIPFATLALGVAVAVIGVANLLYVSDLGGPDAEAFGLSIDPGIGIFAAIGGGILAAGCAYLHMKQSGSLA